MALDMYQATVTPCMKALANLTAILGKAETYTTDLNIDQAVLLNARLFPDMLPLTMQVVIACDTARAGAARLGSVDLTSYDGARATFAELIAGVTRTIDYIETLKPEQFAGAEDRTITWSTRSSTKTMQGMPYLFNYLLPNLFFHVTTAYDILRHSGLNLGKKDYLGNA